MKKPYRNGLQKLGLYIFIILLGSCSSSEKEKGNKDLSATVNAYVDKPFLQEYHERFIIDKHIPEANDVRAVYSDKTGTLWAATKHGVYQKKKDAKTWQLMIQGANQGPAYDLKMDMEGTLWLATWNGVYTYSSQKTRKTQGLDFPIGKLTVAKEGVYALGPDGIWLFNKGQWQKKEYHVPKSIRAVLSDGRSGLWIGTDVGLFHCAENGTKAFQGNEDLISAAVKGLDFDHDNILWVGGMGGVTLRDQNQKIGEKLPKDGIPSGDVTVVRKGPDGRMWVGTNYGISRFEPSSKDYSVLLGQRWLLSDQVRDISFDASGTAWIATAKGISAIKNRTMTLAGKADFFYKALMDHHVREPWIIARSRLPIAGDTTVIEREDDDNDGEYTAMYLAMESFRYAVTKSPEAKERAKKAFEFLHYLREVTQIDGFFARTIIPVSWKKSHDMNRTYNAQQRAEERIANPRQKSVEKRWHVSKDGKWKWKGDTSSDELCGHLFGYYWYYTLVADEDEKERVAHHFSKIMDHLIHNDFNLVGVDGTHTKWGVWSPDLLNRDLDWNPEKALNSLELLSFLKFAYHITKDEKYQKEYLKLIHEEKYIENAKELYTTNPAWETYFDTYLALYCYPPLMSTEEDQGLQKEYRTHLDQWFHKNKRAKSPLVNFTYNLFTKGTDELESSIFFLKDAPLDLIDWRIDNGKREDLQVVREPILEDLQVNELRPPSEYRTIRWDRNPYHAISGNPHQLREPVFWLLPYWMGRYLNLIQ
ncbi:ligand-binding sensor domain-containing protein [Ulvibacterium marinum]|uniref:ligand-binding sensor domain-containing protein n=1 Tax=Ulvibacterium marinum TaxID=2419782 RepID=UPI00249411D2|nr:two-component regulator propeller domain-containing protein [Ulvibacterium marinum]